jgi:hypothetical protein
VALRTNYKIKIAQHKHTIHSNIIKQDKQNFVIHLFRSLDKEERYEAWLASYGFHRLDGYSQTLRNRSSEIYWK